MRSRALRRSLRRSSLALLCALAALTATGVLAPGASAANPYGSIMLRSNVSVALLGSHAFGGFGRYDITGSTSITSMQNPVDPCRVFTGGSLTACRTITFATTARATNALNSCLVTGTTTTIVPVADTTSVDAVSTVRAFPPALALSPIDPCHQLGTFVTHFALSFNPDNTITAASAVVDPGSVDLP
jgi:hypothetical protein